MDVGPNYECTIYLIPISKRNFEIKSKFNNTSFNSYISYSNRVNLFKFDELYPLFIFLWHLYFKSNKHHKFFHVETYYLWQTFFFFRVCDHGIEDKCVFYVYFVFVVLNLSAFWTMCRIKTVLLKMQESCFAM